MTRRKSYTNRKQRSTPEIEEKVKAAELAMLEMKDKLSGFEKSMQEIITRALGYLGTARERVGGGSCL